MRMLLICPCIAVSRITCAVCMVFAADNHQSTNEHEDDIRNGVDLDRKGNDMT